MFLTCCFQGDIWFQSATNFLNLTNVYYKYNYFRSLSAAETDFL